MKPAHRDPALSTESAILSTKFAEAGWTPSEQNFRERQFVIWNGSFYSVAGKPPYGSPCSKSCQTAEEVLAFLEAKTAGATSSKAIDTPIIAIAIPAQSVATDRPKADSDEIARLREQVADLQRQLADREAEPPPLSPDPVKHMIPEEIRSLMQEGESLSSAKRRLTELLWVEQAELRNLRATDRENLKREAEIERLLGLFARLGEI